MRRDFQFVSINQTAKGTEVLARFYEGEIAAENETDENGETKLITRYRRTACTESVRLTLAPGSTRKACELALAVKLAAKDGELIDEQKALLEAVQ